MKTQARSNIRKSAGPNTQRWQNTLRVINFPEPPRVSMSPALYIVHLVKYSDVFESGPSTITGNPLWVPLPTVPLALKSSSDIKDKAMGPKELSTFGIKLTIVGRTKSGKRMLGTNVRTTKKPPFDRFTTDELRRTTTVGAGARAAGGLIKPIPLYIEQKNVKITDRFKIKEVRDKIAKKIPNFIFSAIPKDKQ